MSIITAVHERALTPTLVEMLARNALEDLLILFNKVILLWPTLDNVITWNDHVTVATADWACTVMMLRGALVIG